VTGVINCTEIRTEGVEIMIPILDANGNLPTINTSTNQQNGPQNLKASFNSAQVEKEPCRHEKNEI